MRNVLALLVLLAIFVNKNAANLALDDFFREAEATAIGDRLKDFLENLKDVMRTGNSSYGIPVLDPLHTDFQNLTIKDNQLSIDANVSNAKINGLSSYTINEANFKIVGFQLILNFTWPSIKVKSMYDLYAHQTQFPNFPIFGNGDALTELKDLTFTIKMKFSVERKTRKLSVKTLSSSISLGAIDLDATGLYNNEEASKMICQIVNSALPTAIDFHQSLFIGMVDNELTKIMNYALRNQTLDSIFEIIG